MPSEPILPPPHESPPKVSPESRSVDLNHRRPRSAAQVSAKASRSLYRIGLYAWAASAGGVLFYRGGNYEQVALGILMISLAIWPALQWAKHTRLWFPVFEIFMLTGVSFYALPYLSEEMVSSDLRGGSRHFAALVVIVFQLMAIWIFNSTRGRESRRRDWTAPLIKDDSARQSQYAMIANTAYLWINNYTDWIPYEFSGTLRAIFFGAGIIAVFIQARLWGQRNLNLSEKTLLLSLMLVQIVMLAAQLYLINVISTLALAMIGYTTSSRKIPVLLIVLTMPILGILHSGKSEMRRIYWHEDLKPMPTLAELPAFFEEWLEFGVTAQDKEDEHQGSSLIERASLFQIIVTTVETVPGKRPFLNGNTYIDVPALLIPRFLWPGKPTALESNRRLSMYFGLVSEYSVRSVSVAFGMIAEAYANFGLIGVIALGALFGWFFKKACVAAESAALLSPWGIFVVLLTAWSLQVEMVAATWVSSLFQATLVTVVLPVFVLRFTGHR